MADKRSGEISVTASHDGKPVTLDPLRTFEIPVELREVESTIPCGFRMGWLDGDDKGTPFSLAAGAGCGSKWLTFSYGDRDFCVDMSDVVGSFIDTIKAGDDGGS